jgi:hypothetical protein
MHILKAQAILVKNEVDRCGSSNCNVISRWRVQWAGDRLNDARSRKGAKF